MATHRQRIIALQTLVAGSVIAGTPQEAVVNNEFGEVIASGYVRRIPRRYLLQVLHSTRALDSALLAFLLHYGIAPPLPQRALGRYLRALRDHALLVIGTLPEARRAHYQNAIVNLRNDYMHRAGAAPNNDVEVATLVAEMEACLAEVFTL